MGTVSGWVTLVPPEFGGRGLVAEWLPIPHEAPPAEPIPPPPMHAQVTGVKRLAFVTLGSFFVGVAYLGAVTPGLPTTVWVLIASYFFSRSSPRLQSWLWYSPYFGRLIRDWHHHRGMRRSAKLTAVAFMLTACSLSITFAQLPDWVRVVIGCCGLVGFGVVMFAVPTIDPTKAKASA